jgi:hypothetical protein
MYGHVELGDLTYPTFPSQDQTPEISLLLLRLPRILGRLGSRHI